MKNRRLSDWRKQQDSAFEALRNRENFIGNRRVPHGYIPDKTEIDQFRTAHDVLDEALQAMVPDGPVNGDARMRAARRFARSAEANLERGGHTCGEADADVIFEAAKPLLKKTGRTAWTKLAADLTHQLIDKKLFDPTITANRLRMICRNRGAQ